MYVKPQFAISLLTPTRGRTESLRRCVESAWSLADDADSVEFVFGLDQDDTVGQQYFDQQLAPWMQSVGVNFTALQFEPMGYLRLNEYVNQLAHHSDSEWLMFWNDDAVMETQGWDTVIASYTGEFLVLAVHANRDHPYSIFPIVPRQWLDILGYISPHQITDAWVSQQAYMLDIWHRIPVWVLHDRHDLTGNNGDSTFANRPMLEGNPNNPADFHSGTQTLRRIKDSVRLADWLRRTRGKDMTFFDNVIAGRQDPWQKLRANDPNNQTMQLRVNLPQTR